jgi:hypothetical protein
MENELKKKLEIVRKNISGLVDYLDENRLMESTPDQVWEYILAIEKAVEPEEVNIRRLVEDMLADGKDMADCSYKAGYQQAVLNVLSLLDYSEQIVA